MSRGASFSGLLAALVSIALAPWWIAPAAAAPFEERATFDAKRLTCTNLIGEVRIEGHDGDRFEVIVRVDGKDADRDRIRIEKSEGGHARLDVVFPVREEEEFVYPRLGRGSNTTLTISRRGRHEESGGPLEQALRALGARRISVKGHGDGLEVWADLTIRVPRGRSLDVELGVGEIGAANAESDLGLGTTSGRIRAEGVKGNVAADTGSGEVVVERAEGRTIRVDTGSGDVRVSAVKCEVLDVDTGSGDVTCEHVSAEGARLDTGSGSVSLSCDTLGDGAYAIDTGSGSVEIVLPRDASAEVTAETGSGEIDVNVGEIEILSRDEDAIAFRLGDGAAEIQVDTGSGSIAISR